MLVISHLSFSYANRTVLADVSIRLDQGSHLALLGESGSGKSTLLKLLYGIHDLDSGTISYRGDAILGPKFHLIPGDTRFRYLAQDFGLMPFATVAENVGSFLSNVDWQKKQDRVFELLDLVGMEDFADVKPAKLSGGQQQRVAIAKALASEPELLLLDEPFNQIDAFRARDLKRRLFNHFKERNIACIVATHEGGDALAFADQVAVMRQGKLIRHGNPKTVFAEPGELYVASLFAEANRIPWKFFDPTRSGVAIVYAHQLRIAAEGLQVRVLQSYFQGDHFLIEAEFSEGKLLFRNTTPILKGSGVFLKLSV